MALVDVNIKVPMEMAVYLKPSGQVAELERNALLLYPYILRQIISHGRAAEILGIRKNELIDIYDNQKDYQAILKLSEAVVDENVLQLFLNYLPDMPEFDM